MDWFQPLDGCPRCGLPYEREPGYFLLASLGFNPGFAVFLGLTIYLILEWGVPAWCHVEVPVGVLVAATVLPMPVINLLVARHAKAFWLALDYFFDPHLPAAGNGDAGSGDWWDGGDDDDGNYKLHGPPSGGGGQSCWPPDEESAEAAAATGGPGGRELAGSGAPLAPGAPRQSSLGSDEAEPS